MAASTSLVMAREDVSWINKLPPELLERVLSFLPVPMLCRLRTVCKAWNDLVCSPSFHNIYDHKGKHHHEVCFLTRHCTYSAADRSVEGTTCFVDLDERQWYWIKLGSRDRKFDTRVVAMDEGLVAEWAESVCEGERVGCVRIFDPISRIMIRSLKPPRRRKRCPICDIDIPMIGVATDCVSHSYEVFFMDKRLGNGRAQFLWICAASRQKNIELEQNDLHETWRCASGLPRTQAMNRITRARSAVFFRGDLYAILSAPDEWYIMRYDCQKDTWSVINIQDLPSPSARPQLLASGNKLFMRYWRSTASNSNSRPDVNTKLAMEEIQIPENACKMVSQIPKASLQRFFREALHDDFACVVPRVSSDGSCSLVALVSGSTGRVIIYNVINGSADIFPSHPFPINIQYSKYMFYWAAVKKLNFRDILRKKTQLHPPIDVPEQQPIFV